MNMNINMQQIVREQNYQLKNQISDLKNAFDLNRDILKILSTHNFKNDPQHKLFFQIITRLTTVNNQTMIYCVELIQQRNIVKQENFRLNQEVRILEERVLMEIEQNLQNSSISETKLLMQQQINSLNRELMAANQQRILLQQQNHQYRTKYTMMKQQCMEAQLQDGAHLVSRRQSIKRKYVSNPHFKWQCLNQEFRREIRLLKLYIEQLEYRLILMIKSLSIQQQIITRTQRKKNKNKQTILRQSNRVNYAQRQQVRLLKYALNKIQLQWKQDQYILSITERFKDKECDMANMFRNNRSYSWPGLAKEEHKEKEEEEEQVQVVKNGKIMESGESY